MQVKGYNGDMKKLTSLIVGIAFLAIPVAASADTFMHYLTIGSRSTEVLDLQTALSTLGFLKVAPTGYFGVLTKQAVMAYQKNNNLEQVGSVGPKTRALLNVYMVKVVSEPEIMPPVPSPISNPTQPPATPESPITVNSTTTATTTPISSPNDPPRVTLVSPPTVIPRASTQTSFEVTTDKPANCRYGTQQGMNSSYMTSFMYTGGTSHTTILTNLSQDALYVYYVRCEDMTAHVSQDMVVSFSVTGK
jgi:peptidoglycan hydrolase-like protein with peptidoglycan-binding domain